MWARKQNCLGCLGLSGISQLCDQRLSISIKRYREEEFPTGLKVDLKDGSDILFAAIPHTEIQYCLVNQVVYVKNDKPLIFKHMINPEEDCFV